ASRAPREDRETLGALATSLRVSLPASRPGGRAARRRDRPTRPLQPRPGRPGAPPRRPTRGSRTERERENDPHRCPARRTSAYGRTTPSRPRRQAGRAGATAFPVRRAEAAARGLPGSERAAAGRRTDAAGQVCAPCRRRPPAVGVTVAG